MLHVMCLVHGGYCVTCTIYYIIFFRFFFSVWLVVFTACHFVEEEGWEETEAD